MLPFLIRAIELVPEVKAHLSERALAILVLKYDPNQPRVPAGDPEGGQWTNSNTPYSDLMGYTNHEDMYSVGQLNRAHHFDEIIMSGGDFGKDLLSLPNDAEKRRFERDLQDYYCESSNKWAEELSEEEKIALNNYSTEYYSFINQYMRTGESIESINIPDIDAGRIDLTMPEEEIKSSIDNIRSGISKNKLIRDSTLYRGISVDPKLSIGDTFSDKAFVSTSLNPEVAGIHGAVTSSETNIFRIHAKKGTNVAYVGNPKIKSHNTFELEVLLDSNHKFKVTNIENLGKHILESNFGDVSTNWKIYDVEIL
jgi:hypothetical protein